MQATNKIYERGLRNELEIAEMLSLVNSFCRRK